MSLLRKSLIFLLPLILLSCSPGSVKEDDMDMEATDILDDLEESDEVENDGQEIFSEAMGDGQSFYTTVGGEGWRRLARAIYNDVGAAAELKELNPDIQEETKLESGVTVYFDMEKAMPRPEYLTKGMIERYKTIFAEKIVVLRNQTPQDLQEITVVSGDTLQIISQKLFGTHRLWPELFLLNTDKIDDYDKIHPGTVLSYFPTVDFPPVGGGRLALPSRPMSPKVEKTMDERAEDEYMGGTVQPEEAPPAMEEGMEESMEDPIETGMNEEIPEAMEALPPAAAMEDKSMAQRKTIRPPPTKNAMTTMKDRQEKMKAAAAGIIGKVKSISPKGMGGRTTLYGLLILLVLGVGAFLFVKGKNKKPKLSSVGQRNKAFTFPFNKTSRKNDDSTPVRKAQ